MANPMTIARAAEQAGVGVETIRFYERRGLIAQPRKPRDGGYRQYDRGTVERVRFIRQAQELGFSLREIEELLALQTDSQADCADVRMQAVAKRREVERKIGQLEEIRDALDALIAHCPGKGALVACTILQAIENAAPGPSSQRALRPESGTQNRKEKGPATMKSATFTIEGMHCDGCAQTIKALIGTEPGVQAAEVSFKVGEARILYDPRAIGEDRIAGIIEKAGYRVPARKT